MKKLLIFSLILLSGFVAKSQAIKIGNLTPVWYSQLNKWDIIIKNDSANGTLATKRTTLWAVDSLFGLQNIFVDSASAPYQLVEYGANNKTYASHIMDSASHVVIRAVVSITGKDSTPSTGNTVSAFKGSTNYSRLSIHGSGTLNALTVRFPNNPIDWQEFTLTSDYAITTLTLTNGTIVAGTYTTLAAASSLSFIYNKSKSGWIHK